MLELFSARVGSTFSSHMQFSTGSVDVTATCATSPLSQITSKTKKIKVLNVERVAMPTVGSRYSGMTSDEYVRHGMEAVTRKDPSWCCSRYRG